MSSTSSFPSRDDDLDGVLLYGEGWKDKQVRSSLDFHLKFMRAHPKEQFVLSQNRQWTIVFYRSKDHPDTIHAHLAKPCGDAYFSAEAKK